jgi:UDP-glucose 4-epimerase
MTGAAGNIGSQFAAYAHDRYKLRLTDVSDEGLAEVAQYGETTAADLGDLDALKALCDGVDTVVHLAGNPDPSATWPSLLDTNITGTYHAMVAAKAAGCRRLVFASSIHAVGGYPPDVQVKTSEPVNPGDLYGVTKCFGEALGRYMAEQEGLSVLALRIGAFGNDGPLDYYVSKRDLCRLIECAIEADDSLRWAILHGLSDNRFKRLDLSDTKALVGYDPQADAGDGRLDFEPDEANLSSPMQASGLRDSL